MGSMPVIVVAITASVASHIVVVTAAEVKTQPKFRARIPVIRSVIVIGIGIARHHVYGRGSIVESDRGAAPIPVPATMVAM